MTDSGRLLSVMTGRFGAILLKKSHAIRSAENCRAELEINAFFRDSLRQISRSNARSEHFLAAKCPRQDRREFFNRIERMLPLVTGSIRLIASSENRQKVTRDGRSP